jgi:transcriptional regulator with XRE-family HTH domain
VPGELLLHATTSGDAVERVGASLLLGLCLALPCQSPTSSDPDDPSAFVRFEATTAGPRLVRSETVIAKIRQLSGLTWEQLAQMCGTSRRTLHLWASGRRMHTANEERLLRILGILLHLDRGSSDENRRQLLAVRHDGVRIVDLIAQGMVDEAASVVGLGPGLPRDAAIQEPKALPADRRPASPVDLLDALHDPVHVERGHHPKPRFRRVRRGK